MLPNANGGGKYTWQPLLQLTGVEKHLSFLSLPSGSKTTCWELNKEG